MRTHEHRQDVSQLIPTKQKRVWMLHVGTFVGWMEELATVTKRCIDNYTLQNTQSCSTKSRGIECEKNDNKRLPFGSPRTQYDGIAIYKSFRKAIKEVERFNDRLTKLTGTSPDHTIYFSTGYATQTHRPDTKKIPSDNCLTPKPATCLHCRQPWWTCEWKDRRQ